MNIIKECAVPREYILSAHISERSERIKLIETIGIGVPLNAFLVDNHHPAGKEIHVVTFTGLILIFNKETKVLATVLIARPMQLKRYFVNIGKVVPSEIYLLSVQHCKKNFNHV